MMSCSANLKSSHNCAHNIPDKIVRFVALFILLCCLHPDVVHCTRSKASSSASSASAESPPSSDAASSPSGSNTNHRDRERERELISAQFRAAQDARDLDTGDGGASMDSLSAAAAAGLTDEDNMPLAMSKYMAASASAYTPAKMRMNRYSQTGFYDPYPSYSGALTSIPSSYYPYNAYGYRESNPMMDTYPYYERDRMREIQTRAMQALSPSASSSSSFSSSNPSGSGSSSSSNRDGFSSNFMNGGGGGGGGGNGGNFREGFRSNNDHDSTAMSSGHGGHNDEHGHGWGSHYTSKVNTNAIGLLGLLGLLSLLSNVLLQFTTTTTTTTAAAGRKRRSAITYNVTTDASEETNEEKRERIFMEILPHLTPVAHARDGVLPVECTFNGICMANQVLMDELGIHGRPAGQRISSAIVKLLDKVIQTSVLTEIPKSKHKIDLKKQLESAGLHGRNKKNCSKSFPVCTALQEKSVPSLPFIITMQDLPSIISKVARLGTGVPMSL